MTVYILCFSLSLLGLYISSRVKNNYLSSITAILALLFPCLLAGLRSLNIGTDLRVYVSPMFKLAILSKNWDNYQSLYWGWSGNYRLVSSIEPAFSLLVYIIAKLTANFQVLLFTIQCLIIFPIYFGFKNLLGQKSKILLAMLFFYFTLYNVTLNAIRQSIGIAFAFLGLSYSLKDNKNLFKTFFYIIIGILFHKSTVISIAIYLLYWVIDNSAFINIRISDFKLNARVLLTILFPIISVIGVLNISKYMSILTYFSLIDYSGYIGKDFDSTILVSKLITIFPILVVIILMHKDLEKIENNNFYVVNFSLYFASMLLSTVSDYASRIGYIFQIFNCVYFVLISLSTKRKLIYLIIVLYVIIYWWYFFVYLGYNQTVPYVLY